MYPIVREFFTSKKHKYALLAPGNEHCHFRRHIHRARSSVMLAMLLAILVIASVVTAWPWPHASGHPPCNTVEAGYQCRPDLSHYWGELYSPNALGQIDADDITKVNIRHTLKSSLKFQTYCRSNVISPLPRSYLVTEPATQHVSLIGRPSTLAYLIFVQLQRRRPTTLQFRKYTPMPRVTLLNLLLSRTMSTI